MASIPDWPHANYLPGGGNALLVSTVFGRPPEEFKLEGGLYRTLGIPKGIELYVQNRKEAADRFAIASEGPIGDELTPAGNISQDRASTGSVH